jgi:hypothetical protein
MKGQDSPPHVWIITVTEYLQLTCSGKEILNLRGILGTDRLSSAMRTTKPAELSVQEVDVEWVGPLVFATASVVAFTLYLITRHVLYL